LLELKISARIGRFFATRSTRVAPKILESILVAHAQVSKAAVIGVPDSIKG
jgi:acyl-coenzyme A synthetase/AMP-(fatty) acid ligase